MQFNKINFALAAGFTATIFSFISHLFIMRGGMMHMRLRMMYYTDNMQNINIPSNYPMMGWGMIVWPIYIFFIAAAAGWLFAFFYNMLEKK